MAICKKCGYKMSEGSSFCPLCGTKVQEKTDLDFDSNVSTKSYNLVYTNKNTNSGNKIDEKAKMDEDSLGRKEVYQGEVRKCPNCGEVLETFETKCSACGYEIRNISANQSIKELSNKIEQLEQKRTRGNKHQIDEQIANTIKSFPIPNTKEDIIEFMILASSNIDTNDVGSELGVSNAWFAKTSQAYIKAKTILSEEDFNKVKAIYLESKNLLQQKEKESNRKDIKLIVVLALVLLGLFAAMFSIIGIASCSHPEKNAKEEARLEAIISDAEDALNDHDYKLALRIVESMNYKGFDSERERWWNVKKEDMIDKIIEQAYKDGVLLERSIEPLSTDVID